MLISEKYVKLYTSCKQALQIIYIIKKHLKNMKNVNNYIDLKKCTIVDANAGIGGNSVYFCRYCKFVYCIDISAEAILYLEHNLEDYENKLIINENCLDILKIINYDIIFFDPPWGGSSYKYHKCVNLFINGININKIIDSLYFSCKMIVLKAPINFNINYSSLWNISVNNIYKNDNQTISFKLIIFKK